VEEDGLEHGSEFQTAKERLGGGEPYDIVAAINCLDVETTIVHVLSAVCEGLQQHFPHQRLLVIVMDGGSEDQTRELAAFYPSPKGVDTEVVLQGHGPGKGNGIRSALEIANAVHAQACAFMDGDLISVRPSWLDHMLRPVVYGLADLTVPYYLRDKWDGVITNHLCYPFTAALYGSSVRQPIGGEFSLSRRYIQHLLSHEDIPGDFGIDIFVTTTATAEGFRTMEVPLGIRVHTSTITYVDPRKTLHRMYQEVVGEMLDLAFVHERHWRGQVPGPEVLLVETVVPYYGRLPPSVEANERVLMEIFREGVESSRSLAEQVLPAKAWGEVREALADGGLDVDTWIEAVYAIAAQYIVATASLHEQGASPVAGSQGREDSGRAGLLDLMAALGMGRFLRFVKNTRGMELAEANVLVRDQAKRFQAKREVFLKRLDGARAEQGTTQVAGGDGRRSH
jgi:glucosylglycerate synthase